MKEKNTKGLKMNELTTIEAKTQLLELEKSTFELEQRRALALSKSAFFPDNLKNDVASAVIVYDLANRMNISVMEVAQSIYIIYGRPSFSTSFLVARLNSSGFIKGALQTVMADDMKSCKCTAIDSQTGQEYIGMTVTMAMAKAEGWTDKKGSKWVTMPELMLRKRAQSFFIKEFYPQVMFGVQSSEEAQDIGGITTVEAIPTSPQIDLNAMAKSKPKAKEIEAEPIKEVETIQEVEVVEAHPHNHPEALEKFFSGRGMTEDEKVDFRIWAKLDDDAIDSFLAMGRGKCEEVLERFYNERDGE